MCTALSKDVAVKETDLNIMLPQSDLGFRWLLAIKANRLWQLVTGGSSEISETTVGSLI